MKIQKLSLIICLILYGFDCLILTPVGLTICKTCKEVGLIPGFLFNYIGFWTFPVMFIFASFLFWFFIYIYSKCFKEEEIRTWFIGGVTGVTVTIMSFVINHNITQLI